jgi:AcrR family transcriptional regulator
MVRQVSRRARASQPTKDALLAAVVDLLDTTPLAEVNVEQITNAVGLSHSSIYYHFSDLSELIEQALAVRFARIVDEAIEMFRTAFTTVSSTEEFREMLRSLARITQAQDRSAQRMERVSTVAHSTNNPRFAERLGVEQRRLTASQAEIFAAAQRNGWLLADLDTHVIAAFIQFFNLGRVLDNIDPQPVDQEAWLTFLDHLIDSLLPLRIDASRVC